MIAIPGNVRVWLATGHTDMRRGFPSLARLVQESLKRDPHAGDLYVFRGRRGDLIKIIWHDGQGACLFTKRLERGRFLWPSLADGVVTISVAQLSYLLSGIDWLNAAGNLASAGFRLSCGLLTHEGDRSRILAANMIDLPS
jgi:transposase